MAKGKKKRAEPPANTCARVLEVKNERWGNRVLLTAEEYGKEDRPRLQTGIFIFTWATGGGYPFWIPTKLVGPESGGKSSTAYNAMKVSGMTCWRCFNILPYCDCSLPEKRMLSVICNPENDVDVDWLDSIGVPQDSYMVSTGAPSGDAVLDIANAYLRADDCGLVVIDSLAMLSPAEALEAAIGEYKMAEQARLLTDANRKMQFQLNKERLRGHPVFLILTNQLRANMDMKGGFGSPDKEAGGRAIQYWTSLGVRVNRLSTSGEFEGIKTKTAEKETPRLQKHNFKIKKHRLRIRHHEGEYIRAIQDVFDDDGKLTHRAGSIIDYKAVVKYGLDSGAIEKNPGSYQCGDLFKLRTRQDIMDLFREDENVYYQLHKVICDKLNEREER